MERPDYTDSIAILSEPIPRAPLPTDASALGFGPGLWIFVQAQLVSLALGTVGFGFAVGLVLATGITPLIGGQYALVIAIFLGGLGGLGVALAQLARRAPQALRDRSIHGCAWFGAPDEVVVRSFLGGGALAVLLTLLSPAEVGGAATDAPRLADWQLPPAMLFAFATIAIAPVAEELLFRGLLFASLRRRLSTTGAGVVVTVGFALMHHPQLVARPLTAIGFLTLGVVALLLRLRHASLAPAIAVHSGWNFTTCIMAALG